LGDLRHLLAIGTAVASSAGLFAPYVMGSVIETATAPLDGFNTGFFMCGVIMLVGGAIAMALVNPELEANGSRGGCSCTPRLLERTTTD
jgi:ACS family D-galactonate transporter-like MFS transporter